MTAAEEKKVNNTIKEMVLNIASKNDINIMVKKGNLFVAKEDESKLICALDDYLKEYKV